MMEQVMHGSMDNSTNHMTLYEEYCVREGDRFIDGENPRERYFRLAGIHEEYWYRAEEHLIDGETVKERYARMAGIKKDIPFYASDKT